MSRYFAITTGSSTIQVKNTRTGSVTFTVTNNAQDGIKTRAKISALTGNESWFTIEGEKEREYKEKTQQYTVTYTIPSSVSPGSYKFRMDVFGVENPDEIYSEGPVVQIDVVGAETVPTKKTPFPWWIVAVVVAVLLIGGGIALWATRSTTEIVPMVIGETPDSATTILAEKKFNVERTTALTTKSEEIDVVVAQNPPRDTEADKESTVTITIGQEGAEVPNTIGDTLETALKKITDAGLNCRVGASQEVKEKIVAHKRMAIRASRTRAPAATSETTIAQPNALTVMTMIPMFPIFTVPKVSATDPAPKTIVEKNATITIFTEKSSKSNFKIVEKADLQAIGFKAEVLKNVTN
ncbi:MAG: PASTA domain-containing protein [Desulfobacteraceae bacterium]|jgi:hypothetical protein